MSFYAKKYQPEVMNSSTFELPVIPMLLEVTTNAEQMTGTLIDFGSDTNYISHIAVRRLGLRGEKVMFAVHGVGGKAMKVKTKKYSLKVRVKTPGDNEKAHELICYSVDELAKVREQSEQNNSRRSSLMLNWETFKDRRILSLFISHHEGSATGYGSATLIADGKTRIQHYFK